MLKSFFPVRIKSVDYHTFVTLNIVDKVGRISIDSSANNSGNGNMPIIILFFFRLKIYI